MVTKIDKMTQGYLVLSGTLEIEGEASGACADYAREAAKTAFMSRVDAEAGKLAKAAGIAVGKGFRERFFSGDDAGKSRCAEAIAEAGKKLPKGIAAADLAVAGIWVESAPNAKVASLEAQLAALKAEMAALKAAPASDMLA